MKKILSLILVVTTLLCAVTAFSSCSKQEETALPTITIAVPNDPTNEARALLLLESLGCITLREGAGITATKNDIVKNPYNIDIKEIDAAAIPNHRQDVDYAIINSNYAISAGLKPTMDAMRLEGSFSAYSNILAVKSGNENSDKIKALVAALKSEDVKSFITTSYGGAVVSTVEEATNGFDDTVDYEALKGTTITVAASPTPHAEILAIVKTILETKEITLDIREFTDYVQPNNAVDNGEVDANYFQHVPYLDDFNKENGTNVVSVAAIHVEPMGIYGGKQTTLKAIGVGE